MLEIIREAGTILRDLPDLAIWILVGILFYKVFIIGGAIGLAKFAITKTHDYLVRPKEVVRKVDLKGVLLTEANYDELREVLDSIRGSMLNKNGYNSSYISHYHIVFLKEAVEEKIQREAEGDN